MLPEASVSVQIETQIRAFIAQFYEGWLLCDDQSCLNRTRQISVYGRRCLRPDCRGAMHAEVSPAALPVLLRSCANVCCLCLQYSDKKLYNQLLYFDQLFDTEKAQQRAAGTMQQGTHGTTHTTGIISLTRSCPFRLCSSFRNPASKDFRYASGVSGWIPGSLCQAICGHVKFVFIHARVVGRVLYFMYVLVAVNVL